MELHSATSEDVRDGRVADADSRRTREIPVGPFGRAALVAVLALPALLLAGCGDAGAGDTETGDGDPAAADDGATARVVQDTGRAGPDTAATHGNEVRSTTTLRVGGQTVRAEVADRDDERRQGLMGRDSLPEDHGMLFVYPEQRTLSFWMRDTKIPLDIAFIDRRGVVVDIQTMQPETEEMHRSRQPAMYALEMEAGWFDEHGVGVGDRVEF